MGLWKTKWKACLYKRVKREAEFSSGKGHMIPDRGRWEVTKAFLVTEGYTFSSQFLITLAVIFALEFYETLLIINLLSPKLSEEALILINNQPKDYSTSWLYLNPSPFVGGKRYKTLDSPHSSEQHPAQTSTSVSCCFRSLENETFLPLRYYAY